MPTEAQKRAVSYGPQPDIAAASLRGAIRGEVLPIAITGTSETFVVPDAWKGVHVRVAAQGADVYYQISTSATLAVADKDARAVKTGTPAALTASAGGNDCGWIPQGQYADIPFPSNALTFALQGSGTGVARTHPAET